MEVIAYVFSNCASLSEVLFEEGSALDIGDHAFARCGLKAMVVLMRVKTIGIGAFAHCLQLASVEFESGSRLETVKASAFEACSFPSIQFPPSLRHLQRTALSPNMKLVYTDLSQCWQFQNEFQPFCDTAFISYHHDALRKLRLTVAMV